MTDSNPLQTTSFRAAAIRTLSRLTLLAACVVSATTAQAATLQVCSTCPYTTIQSAVTAAAHGDTIEIAPGSYAESVTITGPRTLSIRASSGRVAIDASGFAKALEIVHPAGNVLLQDLDLIQADGLAGLINHGHATLVTVSVVNNVGTFGGILNSGTLVTNLHSVIAGNEGTGLGSAGGLTNFGWVDMWLTTVTGNRGHEGGGFNSQGNSRVTVFTSSISGNLASSIGGGYYTSSPLAVVDIKSSTSFSANSAPACAKYFDIHQTPDCVN
ncbi:MAG: hypothetical protein AAGN46_13455 [Acidobacteriota bacterium]